MPSNEARGRRDPQQGAGRAALAARAAVPRGFARALRRGYTRSAAAQAARARRRVPLTAAAKVAGATMMWPLAVWVRSHGRRNQEFVPDGHR